MNDCKHQSAKEEHKDMHGTEVEVWIYCPDCGDYWTVHYDLERETASITRDE